MPAGAAPDGVPRHLRIHVRVAVDEAGCDDETVGVDDSLSHRRHGSDLDDAALPDTDVAPVAWRTRAVHDRSLADHEIESHGQFFSFCWARLSVPRSGAGVAPAGRAGLPCGLRFAAGSRPAGG